MANLYVSSTGSNTAPYDTWAKAATMPETAINAAAAGDTVYVQQGDYTLAASVTLTLAGTLTSPISVVCSNDTTNAPPQTLGSTWTYLAAATGYDVTVVGIGYVHGLGLTGSGGTILNIGNTTDDVLTLENPYFALLSGTGSGFYINIGNSSSTTSKNRITLLNPNFTFGSNSSSVINLYGYCSVIGGTFTCASAKAGLFYAASRSACNLDIDGADFSGLASGSSIVDNSNTVSLVYRISNCKLGSTAIMEGNLATGGGSVLAANCSGSDVHYEFFYHNPAGTLTAVTSPYFDSGSASTNALFDGTNPVCWQIVTTANCSYATPFETPWIEKYHAGTSAITPYLEICRSGSATAYKDDEVWGEFSAQATSGFVLPVFKNDRRALNATAADQTTGAGASYWTGENATSWYGKVDSGSSVTPAEIGMLRGRVCVGVASSTVFVDPYIRT